MPEMPDFAYHPQPLASGSIEISAALCEVCRRRRGYRLVSPSYGKRELTTICPWCVASGRAHAKFKVIFNDLASGSELLGDWSRVPAATLAELRTRTPGYASWQGQKWWAHCDDAAAFVGPVGWRELRQLDAARDALARSLPPHVADPAAFLRGLDRDQGATGYLFRCRHCRGYGGFVDDL